MKIGGHTSIVGGYAKALERMAAMGGNCMQIFSSSPRDWKQPQISDEDIVLFREKKEALKIDPVYFHAMYLINLANPERIGNQSVKVLVHELNLASMLGIVGSIIHIGSFSNGDYDTLIKNIAKVLAQIPENVYFIIENAGSRKIPNTLEELGQIISDLKDERVKVCLDTCHLWAAGYDLSTTEKFEEFLSKFDNLVGLENLELFHVNDSKGTFGSYLDRHQNIGQGTIPRSTFELLLNHPATQRKPFILEVPGFDDKGPDKQNIDILKGMVK